MDLVLLLYQPVASAIKNGHVAMWPPHDRLYFAGFTADDQSATSPNWLVELILWDFAKKGNREYTTWFYRYITIPWIRMKKDPLRVILLGDFG